MRTFFGCGDPVAAVDQLTPAQTSALAEVTVQQFSFWQFELEGATD